MATNWKIEGAVLIACNTVVSLELEHCLKPREGNREQCHSIVS